MSYPRQHLRVTWWGDAWAQQEIWSTGLRIDGTTLPNQDQMDDLDFAFATLVTGTALSMGQHVRYVGLKVAPQTVDGLYGENGQAVEFERPTPQQGSSVGALPQATIAATLTTATLRGLANEGRMYLPATGFKPESDGRLRVDDTTTLANKVSDFIDAVNAVGLGAVTVFSRVGVGAAKVVTGVRVGRVIDTQRRRRNNISEEYISVPVGPS